LHRPFSITNHLLKNKTPILSSIPPQILQRAVSPILHLRAVNPYLAGAFSSAGAAGSSLAPVHLPRAPLPWADGAACEWAAAPRRRGRVGGVSSFAFMGTNAHVLLADGSAAATAVVAAGPEALAAARRPLLRPQRLYVVPCVHPFLSALLPADSSDSVTLVCQLVPGGGESDSAALTQRRLAYLWDHQVAGRPLLPATAMLELMLAAAQAAAPDDLDATAAAGEGAGGSFLALCGVSITAPVVLPALLDGAGADAAVVRRRLAAVVHSDSSDSDGGSSSSSTASSAAEDAEEGRQEDEEEGSLILSCRLDLLSGAMELRSSVGGTPPRLHATGTAAVATAAPDRPQSGPSLAARLAALLSDDITFLPLPKRRRAAAAAGICVIASVSDDWHASGYLTNPRQTDSALHLGVAPAGSGAKVPVSLAAFAVPRAAAAGSDNGSGGGGAAYAACCLGDGGDSKAAAGSDVSSFFLQLGGTASGAAVALQGLETRVLRRPAGRSNTVAAAAQRSPKQQPQASYSVEWLAAAPMAATATAATDDEVGEASRLAVCFTTGPDSQPCSCLMISKSAGTTAAALGMLQQLQQTAAAADGRRLAMQVAVGGATAGASSVMGLLRTAATEQPDTAITVTVGARPASSAASTTAGEEDASELLRASSAMAVPRLLPAPSPEAAEWIQIRPEPRSSLANLVGHAVGLDGMQPGPGEVLLSVKAVGLNFRDVLNVLGMYPGDPGPPGSDCSGVVLAVGE
jgi:hypothetical protein